MNGIINFFVIDKVFNFTIFWTFPDYYYTNIRVLCWSNLTACMSRSACFSLMSLPTKIISHDSEEGEIDRILVRSIPLGIILIS